MVRKKPQPEVHSRATAGSPLRLARLLPLVIPLLAATPAHAINSTYAKQLERSGCTQVTELQGCDIRKSKAENAKAGFGNGAGPAPASAAPAEPAAATASTKTPYAGQWVATSADGRTVATIRIDAEERVWVNGKAVKTKRSDGALVFRSGKLQFTIQGDRRLQGEDVWNDFDAGTSGPIVTE
ncbi:hypothetical protein [Hydrogenophaga sp. RWCD_12]|uniref:hypothetical protein n=1 Tax=Hydrogenophaga sp. RWCD_12 TaxID=3391190 RepID=UPI003985046B